MIRELEFQLLCRRYADALFRYARSLLSNPADAEDAVQEVLLRLWNHLPTLNLFHIRPWLYRTTRNLCLDQLRRGARREDTASIDLNLIEDFPDELAVDPGAAADSMLRLELAHRALRRLPETLRSVFVLYEVNGLRYREIAELLSIPINTVKSHLLRARERLSQHAPKEEACLNACRK